MMSSYIVTGANGDIGLSIADMLKENIPQVRVIGTDSSSRWPAAAAGFDEVELVPMASEAGYIETLQDLAKKYSARYIIPTSEPELRWISKNRHICTGIPFLMNDPDLILTCMDKLESMRWLEKIGIETPDTKSLSDATTEDIPFIIKPRYGAGSRGIQCVRTADDFVLMQSVNKVDEMVAQTFLEGEDKEYTCVIVKLAKDYRTFVMHRKLKEGVTSEMYGLHNESIEKMLNTIAEHLPSFCDINVQLRLTPEGPRIFEINPRFSSTVKMRHMLGFSDFLWMLKGMENNEVFPDAKPVLGQKVYRIYKEVMGAKNAS